MLGSQQECAVLRHLSCVYFVRDMFYYKTRDSCRLYCPILKEKKKSEKDTIYVFAMPNTKLDINNSILLLVRACVCVCGVIVSDWVV